VIESPARGRPMYHVWCGVNQLLDQYAKVDDDQCIQIMCMEPRKRGRNG
jgi:hypothetical protein